MGMRSDGEAAVIATGSTETKQKRVTKAEVALTRKKRKLSEAVAVDEEDVKKAEDIFRRRSLR